MSLSAMGEKQLPRRPAELISRTSLDVLRALPYQAVVNGPPSEATRIVIYQTHGVIVAHSDPLASESLL